jgi:predicted dehydrogenase
MTIAVIGLGSMGRRRVRDLCHFGENVLGIDVREDRRSDAARDFGIEVAESHHVLVKRQDIRGVVISVPPDCHAFFYEYCYENNLNFFSEANILTPHQAWFAEQEKNTQARGYPSGTWIFHPLVQRLREKVDEIGASSINTVTHRYGGFLPDWHSWEAYYDFYAGRKNSSATREMVPFEVEILIHCFGRVAAVTAVGRQARDWYRPIDDTMFLILEFESGIVGTLTVELHQVKPVRETRVAMRDDMVLLQLGENKLEHYRKGDNSSRTESGATFRGRWGFYFEDIYRSEIKAWLAALEGEPYPKTWGDDRHLSNILFAAERSSATGEKVNIEQIDSEYDGLSWIDANGMPVS